MDYRAETLLQDDGSPGGILRQEGSGALIMSICMWGISPVGLERGLLLA